VTKRSAALEIGRRVFLCAPTARHRDELVALMKTSRRALRPWVVPPASRAAFDAYLRRSRRPTERAFLVCRREDGAIAGVVNMSQIFHGNFRSAYLGYYTGAPFMGRGYMSEGLRLVVRHAFGALGFGAVYAAMMVVALLARSAALSAFAGLTLLFHAMGFQTVPQVPTD